MKPETIQNIEQHTGLGSRETSTLGIWELLSPTGVPIYSLDLRGNGCRLMIGDIYDMQGLRGWAVIEHGNETAEPKSIYRFDPHMTFNDACIICMQFRQQSDQIRASVCKIVVTDKAKGEFYVAE